MFCAGADLRERATMSQPQVSSFLDSLRALLTELESLTIPSIAVIDGFAMGGGCELALGCDLRVAGECFGSVWVGSMLMVGRGGIRGGNEVGVAGDQVGDHTWGWGDAADDEAGRSVEGYGVDLHGQASGGCRG